MLTNQEMQVYIQAYLRMLEDADRTYEYMIENGKSEEEALEAEIYLKETARKIFNERTR